MEEFSYWLEEEIEKKNLTPATQALLSNVGNSSITRILNGDRKAGPEICKSIAKALGYSEEYVFRAAGLLSPLPADEAPFREMAEIMRQLSLEERKRVIEYAAWRAIAQDSP